MNNRFAILLQKFLTSYIIQECNDSINTKDSYATAFYLFLQFLKEKHQINSDDIKIELINKNTIMEYLNWLEEERGSSIQTRNQRLSAIKSFYKFVQTNEMDLFNTCSQILNIQNKKSPDKIITYFSPDEIKIMINYLNKNNNLKLLTMICVLYETGARVNEFINIKVSDIDLSDNASITLYGKGNKVRIVPISEELVKIIKKYLNIKYIDYGEEYLFYSNRKKKFSRNTINYNIDELVNTLHKLYPNKFNKKYHPHSFRHSKATHLYNNNTPLLYIKDFLGHKSVKSTEIYAKPDLGKQREQILNNAIEIPSNKKYSKTRKESLDDWLKHNM